MVKFFRGLGSFEKNIILVFCGTSIASFFNLLYQLLIAHQLSPVDFAAFNSLLSVFMLFSSPLGNISLAAAKYSAEFNGQGQPGKVKALISGLMNKALLIICATAPLFYFLSFYILEKLKIQSLFSGYILALLLTISWIMPVLAGGMQGLELFKWVSSISVVTGLFKLAAAFLFVFLGFGLAGALAALLITNLMTVLLSLFPLKGHVSLKFPGQSDIDFKAFFFYLFPLALSAFCFTALTSFDMVLIKYFFSPQDSGVYSLAQMVGKIFLFLPGAIGIVMLPKTSGLNARNLDARPTLKRSLIYAAILSVIASVSYNIFPAFFLKLLTGKVFPDSIALGRLFSVSMVFFALLYILIAYFISIGDLRFLKCLVPGAVLQLLAVIVFHASLIQVQVILCLSSILLFGAHLILANKNRPFAAYA